MANSKDIAEYIAATNNISKSAAAEIVKGVFAFIANELNESASQSVRIEKFGTFEVATRAGRIGRNPATGEMVMIPPKDVVKFKPSSQLKNSINPQ